MEKFRVGDKVRFVKSTIFHTNDVKIGETYKIIKIAGSDVRYQVENKEWFKEEELERVDYTYEDLKKSPLGTKLTFEDGEEMIKVSKKRYESGIRWRDEKDFVRMKDKVGIMGKIIAIEEPVYQTVYETKVDILDEAEKRYLKQVIRPYNKVISLQKYAPSNIKLAIIKITVSKIGGGIWTIDLPPFEKNTMYKNMEDNKEYTLEELDL